MRVRRGSPTANAGGNDCAATKLRSAAADAFLPIVPKTHGLHLLVEAGFFHEGFEFGAGQALAERNEAIGESPGGERGDGGVQL
jgi:hypothetical protein